MTRLTIYDDESKTLYYVVETGVFIELNKETNLETELENLDGYEKLKR
jgi:hypothetical protein